MQEVTLHKENNIDNAISAYKASISRDGSMADAYVNLAICYVLAYLIAKKAIYILFASQPENIRGNVAMLCGMCLYTLLNYIGQRLIVFAKKETNE